jgi:hypothetical protein
MKVRVADNAAATTEMVAGFAVKATEPNFTSTTMLPRDAAGTVMVNTPVATPAATDADAAEPPLGVAAAVKGIKPTTELGLPYASFALRVHTAVDANTADTGHSKVEVEASTAEGARVTGTAGSLMFP